MEEKTSDESVLVITDENKNHYIIPIKNLLASKVIPSEEKEFSEFLKRATQDADGNVFSIKGVYKIQKSVRRTYSPPIITSFTVTEPTTS